MNKALIYLLNLRLEELELNEAQVEAFSEKQRIPIIPNPEISEVKQMIKKLK